VLANDGNEDKNENVNLLTEKELWSEESLSAILPGFLLVVNDKGIVVYISQGVSHILGLTQVWISHGFNLCFLI